LCGARVRLVRAFARAQRQRVPGHALRHRLDAASTTAATSCATAPGIGAGAPQIGPRRTVCASVTIAF